MWVKHEYSVKIAVNYKGEKSEIELVVFAESKEKLVEVLPSYLKSQKDCMNKTFNIVSITEEIS